jgi:hypothetical protein
MANKNKRKVPRKVPVIPLGTDLFRLGLRLPASLVLPANLAEFLEWIDTTAELTVEAYPAMLAGFVSAAYEAFPDSPEWTVQPGRSLWEDVLSLGVPGDTQEWNNYFLARYAYSGNDAELAELVRRARHRDGSSAAIVLSSSVVAFFDHVADVVPEALAKLLSLGLDPAAVKFGDFPPGNAALAIGKAVAAAARQNPRPPAPLATSGANAGETTRPASAEVAILEPRQEGREDPPEPPAGVRADPDFVGGTVKLSGKAEAALSITGALNLLAALTETTQRLLIPAEGFLWIDDIGGILAGVQTAAALVVLDAVLANRLGLPERSGNYALRAGLDSVWLAGELKQSTEQGAQFGRYQVEMFKPGTNGAAFDQFGNFEDFNDAKFELAKRVRAAVVALPPEKP